MGDKESVTYKGCRTWWDREVTYLGFNPRCHSFAETLRGSAGKALSTQLGAWKYAVSSKHFCLLVYLLSSTNVKRPDQVYEPLRQGWENSKKHKEDTTDRVELAEH